MQFYNLKKGFGIYSALVLTLIFSACAAAQDFSRDDLATDEGVNAARESMRGKKPDAYSQGCLKRPSELPEIILVGSFAHDRGCMLDGAFVKKRFLSKQENLSKAALESLGWQKAGAKKQEEIALKWTRFGLLAFGGYPVNEANDDFAGRDFQAPRAVKDDEGIVNVTLWIRHPMGMRCRIVYDRLIFKFAGDGSLGERTSLESFSLPCQRN
jgi:hypothetical protein